jgi:hypothetical protein
VIRVVAIVAAFCLTPVAFAGDGSYVDSIPRNIPPPARAPPSPIAASIYAQSDLTLRSSRDGLLVPLAPEPEWETRLFLDARIAWRIDDSMSFSYSGRLNLRFENGLGFPNRENVRNDLREAYLTWRNDRGLFVETGRINLRSGVAEGFNPTDYFKARAVVEPTSADPTVLREDRLGTVMLLGEAVWSGSALTLAVAPKLARNTAPYLDTDLPSFNPMLDRTNAHSRLLAKVSFHLLGDVNPELLAYEEAGRTSFGVNATKGIGEAVIAYLEWSGGRRASLAYEAFRDGYDNGVLPPTPPIPVSAARSFANDLAVGATYATKIGINLDFEYDLHQAAFSAVDWRNWFAGGRSVTPDLPDELWFIRSYANDQQEPMARSSLFLRADWQHAFTHDLALTAFVDTDLRDGSGLSQLTVDYYLSSSWTIGGVADIYYGRAHSDFGSLPLQASILFKINRYL